MYTYAVVASIYNESCRTKSFLICDGFNTQEEALEYINTHGVYEDDYYWQCKDDEAAYIEIEERNTFNGFVSVVTLD